MFTESKVCNCVIYVHALIGLAIIFAGGADLAVAATPWEAKYAYHLTLFGYGIVLLASIERVMSAICYRFDGR